MNAKLKKSLNIAAAAIFVVGLAINVQMTLDDPFGDVSAVALAQQSGTGGDDCTEVGGTSISRHAFKTTTGAKCYNSDNFLCGNAYGCKELLEAPKLPGNQFAVCVKIVCKN